MAEETILILEEETHIQWTLRAFLENERYNVIPASSIKMAMQLFLESEVSGLITEYWIKESCTLETIRELKKRFPEVYVMILTHHNVGENEYEKIMDAGIDDFFLKPLSNKKVLLHLRKGLMQRNLFIQRKGLDRAWIKSNSDETFKSLQK